MESRKLKVVFTSLFYPVFMGRYLWEALLRRKDVEVYAAGPFTDNWIPWSGGLYLPESYVRTPEKPDLVTPGQTPQPLNYTILESSLDFVPDLWLEVNAGLSTHFTPKGKYAIVGTDPHVLEYSVQRRGAHYFFCMQKPYMEADDLWLPYAHDPIWHSKTIIPWSEREFDVSLIGLHYPQRNELVNKLIANGIKVHYSIGQAYEDARDIYHNTRIGLNFSSLQDTTARVFEIMGFGILPVVNRVPDLERLFTEDQHYVGFSTVDEAVDKIKRYLEKPEKGWAEKIAKAAHKEVVAKHTWDHRVDQILRTTGLIE